LALEVVDLTLDVVDLAKDPRVTAPYQTAITRNAKLDGALPQSSELLIQSIPAQSQ